MPCALCGEWAEECIWVMWDRPTEQELDGLKTWTRDEGVPSRHWYCKCYPSCQIAGIYRRLEAIEELRREALRDLKLAIRGMVEDAEQREMQALQRVARNSAH